MEKNCAKNMKQFDPTIAAKLAQDLRALHVPGRPLLLTNVWDPPTVSLALNHPQTKAIATASFAIAAVAGFEDDELTLEDNLYAISRIATRLAKDGKASTIPLTADMQDGYGTRLKEAIESVIEMGVVGINIEDSSSTKEGLELVDANEHVRKIRTVLEVAAVKGVPDFVINARTDCILLGGTIDEAIERGRKYLSAGATTVFVWGGMQRGLRDAEVSMLVKGLDGRVNVIYRKTMENALSVKDIAGIGVSRISMGPGLWRESMTAFDEELKRILTTYDE
jgi:2-methylisocitrate lyase-like PEP mutase family enzyme